MRESEEIIYSINTQDVETVAIEKLSRQLTHQELEYVIANLAGYIDWYGAVEMAIQEALSYSKEAR